MSFPNEQTLVHSERANARLFQTSYQKSLIFKLIIHSNIKY